MQLEDPENLSGGGILALFAICLRGAGLKVGQNGK